MQIKDTAQKKTPLSARVFSHIKNRRRDVFSGVFDIWINNDSFVKEARITKIYITNLAIISAYIITGTK